MEREREREAEREMERERETDVMKEGKENEGTGIFVKRCDGVCVLYIRHRT